MPHPGRARERGVMQLRRIQRYRYTTRAMRKEITSLRAQVSEYRLASLYWRERYLARDQEPLPLVSWYADADTQDPRCLAAGG